MKGPDDKFDDKTLFGTGRIDHFAKYIQEDTIKQLTDDKYWPGEDEPEGLEE